MLERATDEQREGVLAHLRELVGRGSVDLDHEPLVLRTMTGSLKMRGRWQVGATTKASVASGNMVLDLTEAEFDDVEIDLSLKVATGNIKVIVPHGIDVQLVRVTGQLKNKLGPIVALPGAPIIRISATVATGNISLRHPRPPKPQRWWRRRRS